MKKAASVLGILLLLLLAWASVEGRLILDLEETEAAIPNLPDGWVGERVAVLADFQIGMWLDNSDMVARAIAEAVDQQPKAILIAGDFVYHPDSSTVRHALSLLSPLEDSGLPVYAVLGNHDYSLTSETDEPRLAIAAYLAEGLQQRGIVVLENEAEVLDGLYIAGLGSAWAERSRPAEALAAIPNGAPRIIFMHNPIAYRELPPNSAPVAIAAHTHGGQLRIPFMPSESWLHIARDREVIADGWAADSMGAVGNRAYVNRGIGFSIVPLRFRCTPELTMITLRRGTEM